MGRLQIEVVFGTIKVSGYGRNKIAPILLPIGLAESYTGDLGDGVRFTGRLEIASEKVLLPNGLGAFPWVYAGGAQVKEFFNFIKVSGMDHVGVDHYIIIDELRRTVSVGPNTTHGPSYQEDVFRAIVFEP
jgi:hypothetical protein